LKSSRLRLCLCISVFLFNVSGAFALDAILKGDASVNAAHASSNYGALSNLYVGNGNTTFLQFDLTTLPAGTLSPQVSHATLIVFVNRVNAAGSVSVAPVTASWGEYSVTAAAAPAAGSSIGNFPVSAAGQFVSVDVTNQVQAWLSTPAARKMTRLAMRRDSISRSSIKDLRAFKAYKAYKAHPELLVRREQRGSLAPLVRRDFQAFKA
jgi:hypothetical protein